jgi:putative heme transporter
MTRRPRSVARRTLGGTLKILAFLFVFVFFVLPAITNARDALRRLATVEPVLLLAGLGLSLLALVAYAQLTRAALPPGAASLPLVARIQLVTRAITNVVPGGNAAGAAVGYRMFIVGGVKGADAGFALVASAVGSAIVLNAILWLTLLVSIPTAGFRPIYVTMSLIGVVIIAFFAGLVVALMRGQQQAQRAVRSAAERVRFLDGERLAALVRRLSERVGDIASDPALLRRLVLWATLNWMLYAAALWVFLRAFGVAVRPDFLLVAFCVANISAVVPLTPGGLGVFDATLVAMLALFGYADAAGLGVPMYRLAQYWLPMPLGALAYISLRTGPWRIDKEAALRPLRDEAEEAVRTGETVYDWAERYGRRPPQREPGRPDLPAGMQPPPDTEP